VATARNPETLRELAEHFPDTVRVSALDVTRPETAQVAVALAVEVFGGLDVLVNNAGYGLFGAIEEAVPDEYRPMFEVNVFGLIEVTRAALPVLRQRPGGRIVNLSSTAGIAGAAGSGYYGATKFAVEGLSEALDQEVRPLGLRVIIVEPGPFRTAFLGRSIEWLIAGSATTTRQRASDALIVTPMTANRRGTRQELFRSCCVPSIVRSRRCTCLWARSPTASPIASWPRSARTSLHGGRPPSPRTSIDIRQAPF
jgi:NAD(P)-dependent dehydrogenase (short-subunit alcohol dehydrogenase family)